MAYSNFESPARIPNLATRKSSPMTTNFAKGVSTYKPNDTMGLDELRLAENARFDRLGEYGTRKGFKVLTKKAVGHSAAYSYPSDSSSTYVWTPVAETTPITFSGPYSLPFTLYSLGLAVRKTTDNYVVPKATIYVENSAGAFEEVCTVCMGPVKYRNLSQGETLYLEKPITVPAYRSVKIVIGVQSGNPDELEVREVVNGSSKSMAINVYQCSSGSVKSIFEANINGNKEVLFVFGDNLYWVSDVNSAPTLVRALPSGVSRVRFSQNLNEIRYVDGKEAPHKLVPTIDGITGRVTTWTDSAIPVKDLKTDTTLNITMSNIMNGTADNLIYFATDPDTEAVWTYPYGYTYAKAPAYSTTATISGAVGDTLSISVTTISPSGIAVGDWVTGQGTGTAEVTSISGSTVNLIIVDTTPQTISSYDKFSTDFYQNFPAIKTGDPLTAMFNLGGVLYMMTRRNKYQMFAQTAESWSQNASNAQNGTFSQESVVCDLNYAYFANDNGIYVFDGASEVSLTENSIQNLYDAIQDKSSMRLELYKNRLYCFYRDTLLSGTPDYPIVDHLGHCLVYNINLKVWESFDSETYVSATSARQNASGRFLCGHSEIPLIMLGEAGDYADMNSPIAFNLETAYQHFGSTSQLKRISKWRPEFAATTVPYTCECGYSLDFTDQVHYAFSIDLQRQIPTVLDYVWDNPSDYGVPTVPTVHTTIPRVNGEFYRCQVRYQHIAAFEPVIFRSHTLTVQTQRIR